MSWTYRVVSNHSYNLLHSIHSEHTMRCPHVLGIVGYSGSGKTTLIEAMLPLLCTRGLRVALIKHTHKDVDVDKPIDGKAKDTWRHRKAGAQQVLLVAPKRWVHINELDELHPPPTLEEQLDLLAPCDLVLVEGFKFAQIPKIEITRKLEPLLYPADSRVIAVASTLGQEAFAKKVPHYLNLDEPAEVAAFILQRLGLHK
ncbi:molybdopterin-guanine dinucleotide biosynthesis protein B [Parvibium lacunae]|uniref:Molybdopterin-guanine dinucleotide biosynthesis protein B n=1 Tax=Parvibium lacunae TaxID=1888893 RepID=A0A368L8C6_9BURK|nr:molybdopterin-guanine dinucleotide biosynthesis protein B [Parvibium lacunae]